MTIAWTRFFDHSIFGDFQVGGAQFDADKYFSMSAHFQLLHSYNMLELFLSAVSV